jgi:AcrR family transcriptional regulator
MILNLEFSGQSGMGGSNMDGFERRKEHSREDIRKAAEQLFTKFGEDKVSVNDIARQAGVSQATIYNNFGSKEALVHDYRSNIVSAVSRRFREILVLKQSYAEKLQDLFQSWIDMTDRYNIQSSAPGSPFGGKSQYQDVRPSLEEELSQTLLEFIKQGRAQGLPGSHISDEAIMTYIKFIQEGISNHPEIQNKIQRDSRLSQDLLSLFMYGINGREKPAG